jgi:Right handed beta helix region/CotH kinase protein
VLIVDGSRKAPLRLMGIPLLLTGLVAGGVLGFVVARFEVASRTHGKAQKPQPTAGANVIPPGAPGAPDTPAVALPAPALGELDLMTVTIAPGDWEVLRHARDKALERGIILQDPAEIVPATVAWGSERATGTARIKGEQTDHVDTDQWSLRFELTSPLHGMRRFSVEHPKTRGFVMEWLVMATARREGVLAPRSDYVRVAINGVEKGVYYLEEHFSKELLESQNRREGPIVRFDESGMWKTWLQHGAHRTGILTEDLQRAATFQDAGIDAFGEGHLMSHESLNARMLRALQQARDLQLLATADLKAEPLRRLMALKELEGRTVDDLFDADRLGRWLAVYTLFRAFHGLPWHQLRFYHDPVHDRLEPIVFDTGANLLEHPGELALSSPEARWFRSSDAVMAAAFAELGRMIEPAWLEGLLRDLGPQVLRFGAALSKASIIAPGVEIGPLLSVMLPQQIASLREIVRPVVAAGFAATVVGIKAADKDERAIEVEAWATTEIPTQITGFRFANGRVVRAVDALLGLAGEPDSEGMVHRGEGGAVLLPRDGLHVQFRFPIDRRLAGLADVKAIKKAIRMGVVPGSSEKVDVEVLYRTLAEKPDRQEPLLLRRAPREDTGRLGRPPAPTLEQALLKHSFLHYDFDSGHLCVDVGRHELDGDFVLPDRLPVELPAGTELYFPRGAVMLCSAILAEGTKTAPVRLLPRDRAQGWSGLQVLGGAGQSRLSFVEVADCTAVERGGWQSSGGVTCYRAPVEFTDCTFRAARCEDSVNLIDLRFRFERCTFQGGQSDLFDGDFVNGEVIDCRFLDSVAGDAIDVSGSQVTVRGCTFEHIGDKCFSVGEASALTASHCHVISASIAAASKDRSTATLDDLTVDSALNFVLAAFVKKPEFGVSQMTVTGLHWTGPDKPRHIVQTGCRVTVDGASLATQDVDVEALYRQKILGK